MANNNFVVKNGLTVNGSFTANSTAVNASAITATSVNTATANATTSIVVGANVVVNTTSHYVGNSTVNTNITAGQVSLSGVTVNSTIYQGTANNANNLGGAAASVYVNTSAAFTIAGIHTYQANILMGNTTVNTQISNATILISNSTSTTTLGLTDLRIGNTTTNVVISNTTSTFGGNVSIRSNLTAKNTNYTFNLPNVGGTPSWIKLGTFTATQDGQHLFIKVVTGAGYSASDTQETEVYIRFKTSNGVAFDANGFAGDSTYYVTNANNSAYVVKIVGNAAGGSATAYDVYLYQAGTFNGLGSFYTVELGQTTSTWTNSATTTADPGVASSTVQIASNRYIIQSNVAIGSGATSADSTLKVLGTANVSGNAVIGGNLTTTGSISGANVTTTTNVATIGTAAYFAANGNVGIGTSSPGSKLFVTSTTTGTYEIGRFQGVANSSPILYHLSTGGSPSFTLLSFGPQPSAIFPTLAIRGFYSNATGGDAGGYPQLELQRYSGNTTTTAATPSGTVLSRINTYGSNSTSSLGATIIESVAEADFTATSTAGIRFQTTNTGSLAEVVRFAANGNVGIGNNAPNAKLQVTGTANVSGNVVIGGNVSISGVIRGQATALSGDVLLIGDNSKLVDINVIDTAGLYSQSNTLIGSLKLGSNGGIISGFDGKIGIANLSPDATLSVTGTANVSGNVVIGGVATVTGNVTLGSSAFFVGNGVSITTVNATSITTGTLPDARLSSAVVNTSGNFTVSGNLNLSGANNYFTIKTINANGSTGTANQVLTSNGTGLYWANVAAGAVFVRQTFTANATVNTTFTVTNGYTVDSIDVYKNGVKLIVGTEVTASDGSTVVLATPAVSGTIVDVVGLLSASVYSLNINTFSQSYPFVWTNTHIFNVNVTVNSVSMTVGNTTVNAVVNSTGLAIGNSTVNAVVNSMAFTVANSTVNYSYISPTSTQKANTSFFLNANGSWAAISAPAVSSLDAFRIGII